VIGSFNNWVPQPCELHKDNGSTRWILTLRLEPGRYEYAFLVDGKPMPDPHAELYQDDGFGNQNTVLALGKKDEAL
jgi:1,4-alpha-glucan branching enzyme